MLIPLNHAMTASDHGGWRELRHVSPLSRKNVFCHDIPAALRRCRLRRLLSREPVPPRSPVTVPRGGQRAVEGGATLRSRH